jgi:hypothetical protein
MLVIEERAADRPNLQGGYFDAYFEGSHELLHAIGDVLDVRTVFPRLSEIAKRILPHDALTMSSQGEDLTVQLEASSSDDFDGVTLDSSGSPWRSSS